MGFSQNTNLDPPPTMNTWPCPKLDLPRPPFGVPVAPRAHSECIARFAHTFSIGTPCVTGPRCCFEGLVQTMNIWPCPKLDLPRHPFRAPAAPRAQSECIAHFARTFSIGTPRATSLRGCFESLVRTINTWPCLQLNIYI